MSRKSGKNPRQDASSAGKVASPASRPLTDLLPDGEESRRLLQISTRQEVSESFSGPLPPPCVLREYNEIVPGLADRIVAQAERQTDHRISLENRVVESDISRSRAGLTRGFLLCSICIVGGIVCVLCGHDVAGTTIATGAVVGLASVFIYGTNVRKAERTEKAKILTGQK